MTRSKISCLDCLNSNCLIKKSFSASFLKVIDTNRVVNRYLKNQPIFFEGNETFGISFILSGIVKVFKKGAFNKNQIIRFSTNGDILGHRGFVPSNIYPVSAQVLSKSEICTFSKEYFLELINNSPELTKSLMFLFAEELNKEETKLRDMAIFNVSEKVAKALLLLIDKFGLNTNNEIEKIEIFSRQDIAEFVGLNPNQVIKTLGEFKQDKLIEIKGKKIKILSKDKLEDIVSFLN